MKINIQVVDNPDRHPLFLQNLTYCTALPACMVGLPYLISFEKLQCSDSFSDWNFQSYDVLL